MNIEHAKNLVDVRMELEEEFRKGKRVDINDLAKGIEGLTRSRNPYQAAYSQVLMARRNLANLGIAVVPLPDGSYGIPKSQDEVAYAMNRYRNMAKNIAGHAFVLKRYAVEKSILPKVYSESTVKIPSFL